MNSWDILLNILGWGLSIFAVIILGAVIFVTIVALVKMVQDKLDRTIPSLQALRAAGRHVARERYKNDPICSSEQTEAFLEGVSWCHEALRRR